jgi:argininosuccinate lyase
MRNDVMRRGRLSGERTGEMMHFLSSMMADRHIADADILVDIAHVMMLSKQRILDEETVRPLLSALLGLYDEGIPESAFNDVYEDVHAGIEVYLIATVGEETGGRMHMGRSRNDEVAACLRIRLREDVLRQLSILFRLRETLICLAEEHTGTVMPGFTHLQHAQPTTLAHHLLAYEQAFSRDCERLSETFSRVNHSPLGAAAFASTGYPVNREYTARILGFDGVIVNTMDAVSSRDFALEVLSCLSIMMTGVSRLCEEIIIWSSSFAGFVSLDDAFCSTSSIMPQKKNPDTAEIMRAKSASLIGAYTSASATMKGLPMSYNRDLQELTPSLLRGIEDAKHSTSLLNDMLLTASFNRQRMREEAGKSYSTATDLADMLVRKCGLPFRTAHSIVGRAVQNGSLDRERLDEAAISITGSPLPANSFQETDIVDALDVEKSIERRKATGSPSLLSTRSALEYSKKRLEDERQSAEQRAMALKEAIDALIRDARRIALEQ